MAPYRQKPLSEDLRWVLVRMRLLKRLSTVQISDLTDIPARNVRRVLAINRRTGGVMPPSLERTPKYKLNVEDEQFLANSIEHSPDIYLLELQQHLQDETGKHVSLPTVFRSLERMGFTLKKISKAARERNEEHRLRYVLKMGESFEPNQLVFVDESSFDRRTAYRGYAWALKGRRAYRKCFYVRGRRYSVLPALSLNGMLWCHIVEGSYNQERFRYFIEGLLDQMQPFPAPNSVIVMDNARIHKDPELIELIKSRGMKVVFLPAYSPDYNPIEQAFSAIKAYFRRNFPHFALTDTTGVSNVDAAKIHQMLFEAVYSITPEHARAFFHHSGYL